MFRLVSLNLNGIRSAARKGVEQWLESVSPDVIGVQELKAQESDLAGRFERLAGLQGHFHCAARKGYSGVGLYTRHAPSDVIAGFGEAEFDDEGRWIEARFDRPGRRFSVVSCYFPSGSSSEDRQAAKFRFLAAMAPHLKRLQAEREFILVGDVNIAHKAIDLKNWKGNQKNSGFLPEERAWMDALLAGSGAAGHGLVDVFRRLNTEPDQYTWWSARGQAWAKNVGWRIDYHLATPATAATAQRASIHREPRFSDHAPLAIDYALSL